ncbi:SidA/IucD/PvdA family monooxygenase [Nakamurella sp. YIM 132087]|uniref:SidA/IucD/PvdA family monooxygenase n=1 Tax=Nakamurella alba TaxID=2665158 RepID=A0A7K1FJ77_9ACTN|nr:NAD(P)/FAD-dependent oxidoreductase [Nakamurella alba]MTD14191.1 SidA/IucD/PvdA family monooxygenase [Nakamurella alba]
MNDPQPSAGAALDLDVLVIGAGIAGIYQLHKLRIEHPDLRVEVVDAAGGVGGTWYWNRYPGARFDSESYSYAYFFSKELRDDWRWKERFSGQPEIEEYLNHVVDRFELRPYITLGFRVQSATWDETSRSWSVRTADGQERRTRFLVTAVGLLSAPQFPIAPGREEFRGIAHHTALWPAGGVDFTGKRVAVIGTGSSGVQITGAIADEVASLTVFQRTPNWCTPLNNTPMGDEEYADISSRLDEIHATLMGSFAGFVHQFQPVSAFDVSPEDRHRLYEQLWEQPGFAKLLGNYMEVLFSPEINAEFSAFLAGKISGLVTDPAKADKLIPKDHGYGVKRPPFEAGYYAAFNKPNVDVVSLTDSPIERFTPTGLIAGGTEHEFDIIVYATGFDAITGAFDRIDIRAGEGQSLREYWEYGPHTFLGMQSPGYPNLFFIAGPHSTGGNVPRAIEGQVDFLTGLLTRAVSHGHERVEVTPQAEVAWTEHVLKGVEGTVVAVGKDWAFGGNTPGKKLAYRHYGGGIITYSTRCAEVVAGDYAEFDFA